MESHQEFITRAVRAMMTEELEDKEEKAQVAFFGVKAQKKKRDRLYFRASKARRRIRSWKSYRAKNWKSRQ